MGDIVKFKKPRTASRGFAITDRENTLLNEKLYSFIEMVEFHKVESKVKKDKAAFYWESMKDWASTQSPDIQLLVNKMKACYDLEMVE